MTLNISLTPQLEAIVRQKVSGGLYNSASEVIREDLRLMETQDRMQAIELEQLRQDINSGKPTPWSAEEIKQEGRKQRAKASLNR
jgi:antitoxin ParD1/3/4